MNIAAIIPVKTFSNAKTRLNLSLEQKLKLCEIMLNEVVQTISKSQKINKILIVSKDENAFRITKKYDAIEIYDKEESGVNHAVSLADDYLEKNSFDASIVFPQDIPFLQEEDIAQLLSYQKVPKSALIVPSRRFDGTNALVRTPVNLMETHYDEDSYKIHLEVGKSLTSNTSLVFLRRIMMDVDNQEDLNFLLNQSEKPSITNKIRRIS